MRILYLTREAYPSFRSDLHLLFGKYLPTHHIYSDLVTRSEQAVLPNWAAGLAFTTSSRGKFSRLWANFWSALSLLWLARGEYDLIQVRDRTFGAVFGILAAKLYGKKFVYWMSFPFADCWAEFSNNAQMGSMHKFRRLIYSWRGALNRIVLKKIILPNTDYIFAQSDAMVAYLAAYGFSNVKMMAVPMGIDQFNATEKVERLSNLQGKKVLIYIGALERNRHPEMMLDTLAILKESIPDIMLLLVGASQNQAENEWLKQEINQRELANFIHWTGWVTSVQVNEYAQMADLGLSPFPRSFVLDLASPTKAAEYMMHGLPVVATDNPDQQKLIAQCESGLCVPFNSTAFAAAIAQLLKNPDLCAELAKNGNKHIAQLRSYSVLAQSVAAAYQNLAVETQ